MTAKGGLKDPDEARRMTVFEFQNLDHRTRAATLGLPSGPNPAKRMNASRYLPVKVGGFRVPTQDVSGVLGSVRNDAMTVCAHGE
jgi:hypothetical protein